MHSNEPGMGIPQFQQVREAKPPRCSSCIVEVLGERQVRPHCVVWAGRATLPGSTGVLWSLTGHVHLPRPSEAEAYWCAQGTPLPVRTPALWRHQKPIYCHFYSLQRQDALPFTTWYVLNAQPIHYQ